MGFKNPFEPENFGTGFGWDGKLVTVTGSRFVVDLFTYGDGSPVPDRKDPDKQASAHVWEIKGITEDSEAERTEKYSIGKGLIPSEDGEGFEHFSGKPGATFNIRSQAAKFTAALKESGFDVSKLADESGIKASNLVGAQITFKGVPQLDSKGNIKQDKGGYDKVDYMPADFLGFAEGAAAAPATNDNALSNRAYDLVTDLLAQAEGNTLTRIQLIQAVSKQLQGDADAGKVTALVVSDKFNSAAPWKVDGTTISL